VIHPEVRASEAEVPRLASGTYSILLVDDDDDLRAALTDCLESLELNVIGCGSRQEALAVLNEPGRTVQMVLTDLILPDGEGFEIIRACAEKNGDTLTAIMTGYASLESALRAIRLGAYDYITKPFGFDEIEVLIRNMRERVRLIEENRRSREIVDRLYSRIELLREEKMELALLNREMRSEFERLSKKMDAILELLLLPNQGSRAWLEPPEGNAD
jgi:DNA-binding NtrC family response regulator